MIIGLNQHPDIGTSKIGSVKGVISDRRPCRWRRYARSRPSRETVITEGYGMSETSNIVTANPLHTVPSQVVWVFRSRTTMFALSTWRPARKDMPLGERGELICKGPTVMREYWNNPAETERPSGMAGC